MIRIRQWGDMDDGLTHELHHLNSIFAPCTTEQAAPHPTLALQRRLLQAAAAVGQNLNQ